MKKVSVIILILCVFLSCTSNTIYEKPKDLIPKDSMVLLLKDLYVASAARNIKNIRLQKRFSYIPLIYKKYEIDSGRFQRSNFYYTSRIDDYEPMLKKVLAILEKERTVYFEAKKVRDSLRQDSIKKSRKKLLDKNKIKFSLDKDTINPKVPKSN